MAYGSPSSTVSAATQGPQPALPVRVQLRRTKGWKMPPNTVKVDRTTKWGNPFIVGKSGGAYSAKVTSRRHAWQLYLGVAPQIEQLVLDAQAELRGKNLACWCPLPKPYEHDCCHAAVLLKLANGPVSDSPAEPRDSRESDHTKHGIFVHNRCGKCNDGEKPCALGAVHRCDYPRARND